MKGLKFLSVFFALLAVSGAVSAQVTISADFDSGNIGSITLCQTHYVNEGVLDSLPVHTIEVVTRTDPKNPVDIQTPPSGRWFHFRMDGVAGSVVFLKIVGSDVVRPFYSYDGVNYSRFDKDDRADGYTVRKYFERNSVYVAYFAPYTHTDCIADIERWSDSPWVVRDSIGVSGEGRTVFMLTVTDPFVPYENKRKVWIHSRVHTSEAPASWNLRGLVDALVDTTAIASQMRRNAIFYIVPETNPDGVFGGYSRSTPTGVNMEINWNRPESQTEPEVAILKRTIERLTADRPMDVALNLHSQVAPHVTYWIHTAQSTSDSFFRREMLLSALTMNHTKFYASGEEGFSKLSSRFAEGWYWNRFGEKTLAMTFETPYTYYNRNENGEWVTTENLSGLGASLLTAVSDLLDIGGCERMVIDSEMAKSRNGWNTVSDSAVFYGKSYMVAKRKGASVRFVRDDIPKGVYDIYKWVVGADADNCSDASNCWMLVKESVRHSGGRFSWNYTAPFAGDRLDALLFVRRRQQ